ncbi:MAG: hypothetical protein LBO72_02425, partial [Helicobacteraceae bacterium]|nr:hypothetical protein [Helicobacteraceae bacterium]
MQSLALPVDSGSDLALNTKRSAFQGFSNAIKRLFNVEAKGSSVQECLSKANANVAMRLNTINANVAMRLNTRGSRTTEGLTRSTTETSDVLNAKFASTEFIPVEFASAKFTPPPPPSFSSKLTKFLAIAFVSLFLVGCGESGSEGNEGNKSSAALSSAKDITGFNFSNGVIRQTVISGTEINVTIDYYSNDKTPIVTTSAKSDYSPKGAISTFGTAITYTVTAEDLSTKDYQALIKRAIVVNDESDLINAFDAIGDDNDLTQIDLLIANDITLSSPFTIPSEWSSKGIVIENNS